MIRERDAFDLAQIVPTLEHAVSCLSCGHLWVVVRPIGTDYRRLECPFCRAVGSDLPHEVPGLYVSVH